MPLIPPTPVLPPPCDIGAPARYDKWRAYQAEAVLAAADSRKRFVLSNAPVGFGKSVAAVTLALLTDARTCILTSTKSLMGQYSLDMGEAGMIEIRGLNSYDCIEGRPGGKFGDFRRDGYRAEHGLPMACDEAPCQSGAMCNKREGGCLYYDGYRRAGSPLSKLVVTNYAYWMSINRFGEGLGKFDLLILDEAHNAVNELGGFIGTELKSGEIEAALSGEAHTLPPGSDQGDWISWAGFWLAKVTTRLDNIRATIKDSEHLGLRTGEAIDYGTLRHARDLRRVQQKLAAIAGMKGDWIVDYTEDSQRRPVTKFDPVWPGEYAESTLFLDTPKVVMMSATVRPETATELGIDRGLVDFREYPSTFPIANRPIIYIPTAAMNRNSAANGKREWHTRIDQIIARRLDRKGIIHTISYPRAREIYLNSEYRGRMLIHDPTNTRETIARFKASREPLILVSPVLDTGYDFPGPQCRFQIIAKMPFPVTVDKIMKARAERDKTYKDRVTATKLMQMVGRPVRSEDDWAETFIIDSDFGWWWYGRGRKLCAGWFNQAVREEQMLGMAMRPGQL